MQLSFLLIATALLAACGGGGGVTATVPVTVPAALAPEAAAPAYSAGSEESNTLALLNQERGRCGFGLLKQNAKLDQSAAAHAAYLVQNSLLHGHREDPALPGYTGQNETERAAAVGYLLNPVSAVLATLSGPPVAASTLTSTGQVRGLFASPYHLLSILESVSNVGIGHRKKNGTDGVERRALNITMGRVEGVNDLDASQAYSYPCEASTGVNAGLADETPSPIPANLVQDFRLYGGPIAVKVRTGRVLVVTSATITPTAGGAAVAVQILSQANTPRPDLMRANDAYLLPLSVLQPGTSYTVQLAGTNDGQPFSKSFSFTTAI